VFTTDSVTLGRRCWSRRRGWASLYAAAATGLEQLVPADLDEAVAAVADLSSRSSRDT